VRHYLIAVSGLMVFWFVIRSMRYFFITDIGISRQLWYLYYLPMLFIPLFSLFVAISLGKPENARLSKTALLLLSIPTVAVMREACINAARHADATAMCVVSEQTGAAVTLHITNDGRQPEGDITPRGGLVYLEKQITRAGGRMEIQSQPEFLLTVTLPVGAEKQEQEVQV